MEQSGYLEAAYSFLSMENNKMMSSVAGEIFARSCFVCVHLLMGETEKEKKKQSALLYC